jgi:DNA-binding MarR family transcriptional regulator
MKNLLKQKDLTPQDKLVIMVIIDNLIFGECKLTSNEIGALSGLSRKKVVDTLDKLSEMDMIKCTVQGQFRSRTTTLTPRLLNLIT